MPTHLTARQRHGLRYAFAQGINAKDPAPVTLAVVDQLVSANLIELRRSSKGRLLWKTTELGTSRIASDGLRPIYLHRRGFPAYTRNAAMAMTGEPEPIGVA